MLDLVIIGGINLDICSQSNKKIVQKESNMGSISFNIGGVANNIALNLARLGLKFCFISSVGDDFLSQYCLYTLQQNNIKISYIKRNKNVQMPIYSYVLDNDHDMQVAINDMKAIELLTIDDVIKHLEILRNAKYIILDTNLNKDVIEWVCTNFSKKILTDGVSAIKVKKLKRFLPYIHTIKLNKNELESLLEVDNIQNQEIPTYISQLLHIGVTNVFVSNGIDGIYFNDKNEIRKVVNPPVEVVNASGCGDALASGIFYSVYNWLNKSKQVINGLKLVNLTLKSNHSTSNEVNERTLI